MISKCAAVLIAGAAFACARLYEEASSGIRQNLMGENMSMGSGAIDFHDIEARIHYVAALRTTLEADWTATWPLVERHADHPSPELRRDVYAMVWDCGRMSSNWGHRQQAVRYLLMGANKEQSALSDQILRWLQVFTRTDFDYTSLYFLRRLPWTTDDASDVLRLVGIAELRDLIPQLQALAVEFESAAKRRPFYAASDEWASLLALSRMGDEAATARVIEQVEREKDIIVRATLLYKDVGYTRQRAFDFLRSRLATDERLPRIEESIPGIPEALYVIQVFAERLANFPMNKMDFVDADIEPVRKWAANQMSWDIK
jgi:hypothetical protein